MQFSWQDFTPHRPGVVLVNHSQSHRQFCDLMTKIWMRQSSSSVDLNCSTQSHKRLTIGPLRVFDYDTVQSVPRFTWDNTSLDKLIQEYREAPSRRDFGIQRTSYTSEVDQLPSAAIYLIEYDASNPTAVLHRLFQTIATGINDLRLKLSAAGLQVFVILVPLNAKPGFQDPVNQQLIFDFSVNLSRSCSLDARNIRHLTGDENLRFAASLFDAVNRFHYDAAVRSLGFPAYFVQTTNARAPRAISRICIATIVYYCINIGAALESLRSYTGDLTVSQARNRSGLSDTAELLNILLAPASAGTQYFMADQYSRRQVVECAERLRSGYKALFYRVIDHIELCGMSLESLILFYSTLRIVGEIHIPEASRQIRAQLCRTILGRGQPQDGDLPVNGDATANLALSPTMAAYMNDLSFAAIDQTRNVRLPFELINVGTQEPSGAAPPSTHYVERGLFVRFSANGINDNEDSRVAKPLSLSVIVEATSGICHYLVSQQCNLVRFSETYAHLGPIIRSNCLVWVSMIHFELARLSSLALQTLEAFIDAEHNNPAINASWRQAVFTLYSMASSASSQIASPALPQPDANDDSPSLDAGALPSASSKADFFTTKACAYPICFTVVSALEDPHTREADEEAGFLHSEWLLSSENSALIDALLRGSRTLHDCSRYRTGKFGCEMRWPIFSRAAIVERVFLDSPLRCLFRFSRFYAGAAASLLEAAQCLISTLNSFKVVSSQNSFTTPYYYGVEFMLTNAPELFLANIHAQFSNPLALHALASLLLRLAEKSATILFDLETNSIAHKITTGLLLVRVLERRSRVIEIVRSALGGLDSDIIQRYLASSTSHCLRGRMTLSVWLLTKCLSQSSRATIAGTARALYASSFIASCNGQSLQLADIRGLDRSCNELALSKLVLAILAALKEIAPLTSLQTCIQEGKTDAALTLVTAMQSLSWDSYRSLVLLSFGVLSSVLHCAKRNESSSLKLASLSDGRSSVHFDALQYVLKAFYVVSIPASTHVADIPVYGYPLSISDVGWDKPVYSVGNMAEFTISLAFAHLVGEAITASLPETDFEATVKADFTMPGTSNAISFEKNFALTKENDFSISKATLGKVSLTGDKVAADRNSHIEISRLNVSLHVSSLGGSCLCTTSDYLPLAKAVVAVHKCSSNMPYPCSGMQDQDRFLLLSQAIIHSIQSLQPEIKHPVQSLSVQVLSETVDACESRIEGFTGEQVMMYVVMTSKLAISGASLVIDADFNQESGASASLSTSHVAYAFYDDEMHLVSIGTPTTIPLPPISTDSKGLVVPIIFQSGEAGNFHLSFVISKGFAVSPPCPFTVTLTNPVRCRFSFKIFEDLMIVQTRNNVQTRMPPTLSSVWTFAKLEGARKGVVFAVSSLTNASNCEILNKEALIGAEMPQDSCFNIVMITSSPVLYASSDKAYRDALIPSSSEAFAQLFSQTDLLPHYRNSALSQPGNYICLCLTFPRRLNNIDSLKDFPELAQFRSAFCTPTRQCRLLLEYTAFLELAPLRQGPRVAPSLVVTEDYPTTVHLGKAFPYKVSVSLNDTTVAKVLCISNSSDNGILVDGSVAVSQTITRDQHCTMELNCVCTKLGYQSPLDVTIRLETKDGNVAVFTEYTKCSGTRKMIYAIN